VWINGYDATKLEDIEAALPNLIALVNDPRIQAAKAAFAAYRATMPAADRADADEAMGRKQRLLHMWAEGFTHGREKGIKDTFKEVFALLAPTPAPPTVERPQAHTELEQRGVTPEGVTVYRGCFVNDATPPRRAGFTRLEYDGVYVDIHDRDRPEGMAADAYLSLNGDEYTYRQIAQLATLFTRANEGISRILAEQEGQSDG
jgi:hypothetical protein